VSFKVIWQDRKDGSLMRNTEVKERARRSVFKGLKSEGVTECRRKMTRSKSIIVTQSQNCRRREYPALRSYWAS
jgi:hypothetical protein